jgi:hypothetical protein
MRLALAPPRAHHHNKPDSCRYRESIVTLSATQEFREFVKSFLEGTAFVYVLLL